MKKMMIITEVKTITVDRNPYEIEHMVMRDGHYPIRINDDILSRSNVEHFSEWIQGRQFWRHNEEKGTEKVLLGFSQNASKELGMAFEDFESLEKQLDEANAVKIRTLKEVLNLEMAKKHLIDELETIKDSGFWKRLKFLFTGVK